MPAIDPTKIKVVKEFNRPDTLFCTARVPNSSRIVAGSSDFKVYDIDLSAEKPQPAVFEGHQSYVTGVAVVGAQIVSGGFEGKLIWWSGESRKPIRTVDAHERWIRNVIATADGKFIISVADDMKCRVWEAESGKLVHTLADHKTITPHHYPSMLYAVTASADGKYLATGDKVGHIAIWDALAGRKVGECEAPVMYTWDPVQRRHSIGGIRSLAFSADSKLLAAGGIGTIENIDHLGGPARVEVFDWQAGKRVFELTEEKSNGLVEQLAFHPQGDWLFAAGGDNAGFLKFYGLKKGELLHTTKAPMHVHAFAFNDAFDTICTVGNNKIAVWGTT